MRDKILGHGSTARIINCIGTKPRQAQGLNLCGRKRKKHASFQVGQRYQSTQFIPRRTKKEMLCPGTGDHLAATLHGSYDYTQLNCHKG